MNAPSESNRVLEERLKSVETALLRIAKSQEAASKANGDKTTKESTYTGQNETSKLLNETMVTGKNVASAAAGDPSALIKQTFSALKEGVESLIAGIDASAKSLTAAKITDPKEAVTKIAQQAARVGHIMSREEIETAGRQLAAPNVAADTARKNVNAYYAGQGVLGRLSESIFDYNIEQGFERGKNRLGNWWSKKDTMNWDYHNKLDLENQSRLYNAATGGQ